LYSIVLARKHATLQLHYITPVPPPASSTPINSSARSGLTDAEWKQLEQRDCAALPTMRG